MNNTTNNFVIYFHITFMSFCTRTEHRNEHQKIKAAFSSKNYQGRISGEQDSLQVQ
jgi:hypothetical protein